VTPLDTLQATLDAIDLIHAARRSHDGINAVTGILWRAADVLDRDARRMLTGPAQVQR
jgi:hypothetical protein